MSLGWGRGSQDSRGGSTQGFLVTKLPGRSPNGASGGLCGRRTHNRDFCSLCVWKPFPHLNICSFPTSKCRQLCKLEEIQTLTTRQLLQNPARAKQTRCSLKTSQQCQVLTRVRSHRNTCYCWQPCKDGRAHWKAVGRPALFCFQCWELNPEPHI